jgi:PAS domain-containing protein
MVNRRDFIKGIAGLTAASAFYPVLNPDTLLAAIDDNGLSCEVIREPDKAFIPKRIFCQFEDDNLRTAITKLAEDMNCEVIDGAPFSTDMLALSGFVNLIDRNIIDKEMWQEYVQWYDEFRRDETCIIVDNILLGMPMPVSRYMPVFDLNNPYAVPAIITTIKALRDVYAESYRRKNLISSIFNTIDSGLILLDHNKNIVMINVAACTMLKVFPEKIDFESYNTFLSQIKSKELYSLLKERGVIAKAVKRLDDALGTSWTLIVLDRPAGTTSI